MGLAYLLLIKRRAAGSESQDDQNGDGERKEALGSSGSPAPTGASTTTSRGKVRSAQTPKSGGSKTKSAQSGTQKTASKKAASGLSAK